MINDLKELKQLLQLCRKQGVTDIELGTIKIKLGELPVESGKTQAYEQDDAPENQWANFPQGILTPEELTFYSSGGRPEDAPKSASGDQ